MHTYTRRLASSATSTSRSASTSMAHHHHHHAATATWINRSNSSTALEHNNDHHSPPPPILTTTNAIGAIRTPVAASSRARSTSSSAFSPVSPTTETYTRAELQTIAESLLAHVSYGPYHLASSPVPNSAIRAAMQTAPSTVTVNPPLSSSSYASSSTNQLYNPTLGSSTSTIHAAFDKENLSSSATPSSPLAPIILLGPSARRHFEGKEGHRENNHPRARFTIGPSSESTSNGGGERGRGLGRKSVGTARNNPPSGIAIALRRNVALAEESPLLREVESEADYGLAAYSHARAATSGAWRAEEEEEGRGRDRGRKVLRRAS